LIILNFILYQPIIKMPSPTRQPRTFVKAPDNNNLEQVDELPEDITDTSKYGMIKGDEFLVDKITELYGSDDSEKKENLQKLISILSKIESVRAVDFDAPEFKIEDIVLNFQNTDMKFPKIVSSISHRANANDLIKYFLYKCLIERFQYAINGLITQYKDEAKQGKPYNKKRVKELREQYDTDCKKLIKYKKKLLTKPFRSLIDEFKLYDYYDDILVPNILIKGLLRDYFINN